MSIVARRSRVVAGPRSRLLRFERPAPMVGVAGAVDSTGPSGADLDPDDPRHELARLALDLVVRTSEPLSLPPRWNTVPFGCEVDRTRAHLAPIRTRAALATSFSREASVAVTRTAGPAPASPSGPVRIAYAIRWLELGDDRPRSAWASITNGVAADLAAAIDPLRQRIGDSTR